MTNEQLAAMKQLIEDIISMMEYHVEQTRPIHSTTVALQAAKDALKAMDTTPTAAQRQWQGLTDEEIKQVVGIDAYKPSNSWLVMQDVRAIEAKLREKNGGQA